MHKTYFLFFFPLLTLPMGITCSINSFEDFSFSFLPTKFDETQQQTAHLEHWENSTCGRDRNIYVLHTFIKPWTRLFEFAGQMIHFMRGGNGREHL